MVEILNKSIMISVINRIRPNPHVKYLTFSKDFNEFEIEIFVSQQIIYIIESKYIRIQNIFC